MNLKFTAVGDLLLYPASQNMSIAMGCSDRGGREFVAVLEPVPLDQ